MNYHNITKDDMLNGDGLRVVLWVAGCSHHCYQCQNPETWNALSGIEFDEKAENELFEALKQEHISGITFSGGDPLFPANRKKILDLVQKVKKLGNKTVWLYTGFRWGEIKDLTIMNYVDVLIDGHFEKSLNDNNLKWVGSLNQRIIDVQKSLENNELVLFMETEK